MTRKKWQNTFLIFLGLMYTNLFAQIEVGQQAPDFSLPDTAGIEIRLSDFDGQIVVLNFFTTWCIPCQIESPLLEDSIWNVYRDRGVVVIGSDFMEATEPLIDFIQSKNLTYYFMRDTAGTVFNTYGYRGFPANVIIDQYGQIAFSESGYDISKMQNAIDSLLSITSIESGNEQAAFTPNSLELVSVYPNPFNGPVVIKYHLEQAGQVRFQLFNINGQRIMNKSMFQENGTHSMRVDMQNLASGSYPFSLQTNGATKWGRLVMQK